MNTKLHAICDHQRRALDLFVTAGQVGDYIEARAPIRNPPKVECLLGDRGYDADWSREALKDKGVRACFLDRRQRKKVVRYDKRRGKRRNRIEIVFGRLKDRRRVTTRYDRCQGSSCPRSHSKPPFYSGYEPRTGPDPWGHDPLNVDH